MSKINDYTKILVRKSTHKVPGRPRLARPDSKDIKRLYTKEDRSIREIAELLGYTKDVIYRAMKEYGIERHKRGKRSRLRGYNPEYLIQIVKENGYRKAAESLGISASSLWQYINHYIDKG